MAVPNNKRWFTNHQSGAEEYIEEEKTISMFKVMICNVFVCNVWKAAGLFADINNQVSFLAITSFSHRFFYDTLLISCSMYNSFVALSRSIVGRPRWTTTTAWPTIGLHFTTISCRLIRTNIQLVWKRTNKHSSIQTERYIISHTSTQNFSIKSQTNKHRCSTAPVPEICSDVDPENKLCQGEEEEHNNHKNGLCLWWWSIDHDDH